ncbi:MAG: hypothetical protein IPG76_20655 [Acidobacteria bacterium]|nr:hypothetical protein [Acidobacteriota bacterium]
MIDSKIAPHSVRAVVKPSELVRLTSREGDPASDFTGVRLRRNVASVMIPTI